MEPQVDLQAEVKAVPSPTQPAARIVLAVITILMSVITIGLEFYVDNVLGNDVDWIRANAFTVKGLGLSFIRIPLLVISLGVGLHSLKRGTILKLLIAASIILFYLYFYNLIFF